MAKCSVSEIPDTDVLYYRIHKTLLSQSRKKALSANARIDEFPPSLFRFKGGSLSVDWSEYSTPQEAKDRAGVPEDNGIVEFKAGPVREDGHTVTHTPIPENPAHSSVCGVETEVRFTLSRIAQWTEGFHLDPELIAGILFRKL